MKKMLFIALALCLLPVTYIFSQTCTNTVVLENHVVSGTEVYSYLNTMIIVRNGFIVPSGATAIFETDCEIRFEDGFEAQQGSVVEASIIDQLPPTCKLVGVFPGPPIYIEFEVKDMQSGLGYIEVLLVKNATLEIPSGSGNFYSPGDIIPLSSLAWVRLKAEKINQNASSSVVVCATDRKGNSQTCDPVYTQLTATVPEEFELQQNFPNPFNPTTTIHFNISAISEEANSVKLIIYDLMGREVKTLINENMEPGEYSAEWDGTNNRGETVAGGVYIYRMVAGDFVSTKKMILLK